MLIFDRQNSQIFCSVSDRCDLVSAQTLISEIQALTLEEYNLVHFTMRDSANKTVYHTNVGMSILPHHVVICLDAIEDPIEREAVLLSCQKDRKVVSISISQMESFCGNILCLRSKKEEYVLLMSTTAVQNFGKEIMAEFEKSYTVLAVEIPTIEKFGGGGVRCLITEIY